MRTSIELPDELFRQLKTLAVQRGVTLKALLRGAVENELKRPAPRRAAARVRFPILDSKQPGTLAPTNADIEDLLA